MLKPRSLVIVLLLAAVIGATPWAVTTFSLELSMDLTQQEIQAQQRGSEDVQVGLSYPGDGHG